MILEGIVTTENADGTVNIAPMGPTVDERAAQSGELATLTLRPFRDSTTCANLRRTGRGVFHVVDDAELLARAAIGWLDPQPKLMRRDDSPEWILTEACRWYAFRASSIDDSQERVTIEVAVTASGRLRDFVGFHRARHAVLEAAILATRVHLLAREAIVAELDRLDVIVGKTGDEAEHRAMRLLRQHVETHYRGAARGGAVRVRAPSRLHFGLLSFGHAAGRQFGGAGAMIDAPGLELQFEPAERLEVAADSPTTARLRPFAERVIAALGIEAPNCRLRLTQAPREHIGLGVGTQLALAVAAGLCAFFGRELPSEAQLAAMLDRGRRSWVGLYGFRRGGLIVEAGRWPHEDASPLLAHVPLPADWRFVLICPRQPGAMTGVEEQRTFERLPPVARETTDRLCRELLLGLIPAAQAGDFAAFGESLARYNHTAGECFSAAQGGPFAGHDTERLVRAIGELGVAGVGQSSWGPTVFALVADAASGERLAQQICQWSEAEHTDVLISAPSQSGAQIERLTR